MTNAVITNQQNGASIGISGNTITVTVENKEQPKPGEYNLKLIKVDSEDSAKLQGAEFKINTPKGETTETTNSSGEINIGNIEITGTGTDTITIEETKAPTGYDKIINNPINVQVTKELGNNNQYTMTDAVITNSQEGSSISVSGDTITVTVENKEQPKPGEYNLKLVKVDSEDSTRLQGATFKITSPKGDSTQNTDSNGEINIGNIGITGTGTDTITIEETKAPAGYDKIITSPITVSVTKALGSNNQYTMTNATITNQQNGADIEVSGNTITVTVENKEQQKNGEYNLKLVKVDSQDNGKKLQGAEFKINTPKGETTETTNASGEINIGNIGITGTGTDTITIEETKAPAGYDKIITSPITVSVTKALGSNNQYTMTNATITNQQNGADIEVSGNTITVTVENREKEFDLALRKYITKVNGEELTDTRVPSVSGSSLQTGTTATYNHRKDPVVVKTGDTVTYNITIYNEGENAGRATKIEDQLPTGLKFSRVVSGNFELDSYSETDNLLKLKRTDNTDNLPAFDGTTMHMETIELECIVTGVASSTNIVLTNVAWISEEYDAELNRTITTEEGLDRDSVPGTHPNVNKDNMEDYSGNNNKPDLTDKDYYYKGQEDDDDFEKLIIEPGNGTYSLKLIKVDSVDNSKKLEGAEFKITSPNGDTTETTNENGEINIGPIAVTGSGTDTITIEETKAPTGYDKIITSPITVNVTKALVNGTYSMTNAVITNEQEGASIEVSGNTITVTVENKEQPKNGEYNLKIVKVDSLNDTKKLQGAEFKITSPNGESTQTTNENGEINIGPISITGEGTDTITIEETKAPAGYDKIISSAIKVQVTKVLGSNNQYTMTGAQITNTQNGASIGISGNTITVTVENKFIPKPGEYNLKLVKVDSENNDIKLQGAEFKITSPNGSTTQTTNANGEIDIGTIAVTEAGTDTITIEETKAPDGYNKIITDPITVQVTKALTNNNYTMTNAVITNQQNGASIAVSGNTITVTVENKFIPKPGEYNLKLIKVDSEDNTKKLEGAEFKITSPNGEVTQTTNASGEINIGPIAVTEAGTDTITIEETKAPEGYNKIITSPIRVQVTKTLADNNYSMTNAVITNAQEGASIAVSGNIITVTVENKIIPKPGEYNLKLIKVDSGDNTKKLQGAEFKITSPNGESTQTTDANGEINIGTIAIDQAGNDTITIEETKAPAGYDKIIEDSININVTKELVDNVYTMTNAEITNAQEGASMTVSGNTITITVENREKTFDLALRKYITKVNGEELTDTRVPSVDGSSLQTGTTATYNHRKDPVVVKTGDVVTYNITIYNEGEKAGRATKLEDQLPTGLRFNRIVSGNFELDSYDESDNLLKLKRTDNTDNLEGFDGTTMHTETVEIECTVIAKPTQEEQVLTNVAWISEEYDAELDKTITDEEGADRDSVPGTHPDVNKDNMEDYTGNDNKEDLTDKDYYYKGQEDDDDFEKVVIEPAEGKYNIQIIKVDNDTNEGLAGAEFKVTFENGESQTLTTDANGNINISDIEITEEGTEKIKIEETEAPEHYKKLFESMELEITKELSGRLYNVTNVKVVSGESEAVDVTLEDGTIKITVKNEKKIFDLALRKFITGVNDTEITNRVPELSIGEDGNIKYDHTKDPVEVENGNIVIYTLRIFNEGEIAGYASKVKDDVPEGLEFLPDNEINQEYRWVMSEDGTSIETDYLSKEQEETEGANLIKAFDKEAGISETNPDYRDIKIAFKVTEPNTSDRILVNTAEISDDRDDNNEPVEDIDSTPDNNNEWNEEDDLDKEFVKVKYFDLSLKKWVSKAIITNEDGSQTVQETGHTGEENPEPPAKVDIGRQDINKVTVKFEFQIKITNEGEIAGYAKEVTDYIPEGLRFEQADNPLWYTREDLNGRERVGTRQLENTLLQPGESATVSIVLTWINGQDNMGLKTNIAEISEDYNESNTPDIDSTPDNFKEGEDDIDDAPVMLTVTLGETKIYIGLGLVVVAMLTGGVWAIKRYVL